MANKRGGAKGYIPSEHEGCVVLRFTDSRKVGSKGPSVAALTNEITVHLFEYLIGYRIPTYFVRKASETEILVRHLEMLPIFSVVWNTATGAFAERLQLKEGTALQIPVIEHHRRQAGGDALVNDYHLYALGLVTPEQLRAVTRWVSRINIVLRSFFSRRGLGLLSLSLEFGVADGQLMVGGEISHRTCLLSDLKRKGHTALNSETMDADEVMELYHRIFRTA